MDSNYWKKKWTTLEKVKEDLQSIATKIKTQCQDEGFGTPENVYYLKNTTVTLKDSTLGTCCLKECEKCDKFPCQSGIVSMILTSDGALKICSLSNDYCVDMKPIIKNENASKDELREII